VKIRRCLWPAARAGAASGRSTRKPSRPTSAMAVRQAGEGLVSARPPPSRTSAALANASSCNPANPISPVAEASTTRLDERVAASCKRRLNRNASSVSTLAGSRSSHRSVPTGAIVNQKSPHHCASLATMSGAREGHKRVKGQGRYTGQATNDRVKPVDWERIRDVVPSSWPRPNLHLNPPEHAGCAARDRLWRCSFCIG